MANERTWFEFRPTAAGSDPEILIYDYIGAFGVTAKDFHDQLKALGNPKNITVHINSPGGEVFPGTAIYNMLRQHKARITMIIDGVAASMASLIAMAGDEIIMPANSFLMIHNPGGFVLGTSKDLRDHADMLDKLKQGMVEAYTRKSGKTDEEVAQIMDDETWYTAAEAVEAGFADKLDEPVQIAATFDFLSKYRNPPDDLVANRGTAAPTEEAHMSTNPTAPAAVAPTAPAPAAPIVAVAPAPAPAPAETQEQMTARITAEVNAASAARVNEITSLCALTKQPEKVAEFIASGKSAAEVLAALTAAPATPAPAAQHQLNTQLPAGGESDADRPKAETIDTQAIYARYNTTGQKVAR